MAVFYLYQAGQQPTNYNMDVKQEVLAAMNIISDSHQEENKQL